MKFRIWHIPSQSWIQCPEDMRLTMDGKITDKLDNDLPQDIYIVQRWTGLMDKNGKEIYEGDLVKVNKSHSAWLLKQIFSEKMRDFDCGQIKWINQSWEISQRGIGASYLSDYACCEDEPTALEVIGNIFRHLNVS